MSLSSIVWNKIVRTTAENSATEVLIIKETQNGRVLEQLRVNKYLLTSHSPVFEQIFFGPYKERESGQFEIVQPKVQSLEMMFALLDMNNEKVVVNKENVDDLLFLSDFYQVHTVRNKCSKFVQDQYSGSLLSKLRIAEKHRLVALEPTIKALCKKFQCQIGERITLFHDAVTSADFDEFVSLLCLGGQYIKKISIFGGTRAYVVPFWLKMDILGVLMKAALDADDTKQIIGDIILSLTPPVSIIEFNNTVAVESAHVKETQANTGSDSNTHQYRLANKPTGKTFFIEVCMDKPKNYLRSFEMHRND